MISRAGWWTWTPSATPLQPKNKMLVFGLRSTSDDWLVNGLWAMDYVQCSFLDYVDWLGWLMDLNSLPPFSSQENKMLNFGLRSISGQWTQHLPPSAKKIKCWITKLLIKWSGLLDYVQLLMIGWVQFLLIGRADGLQPYLPPLSSQKIKCSVFGLHSTSDDWLGWSMDSKLLVQVWSDGLKTRPPLSSQKIKCSFLDYIQLLMISQAGQWTRNPSATPLQPKIKYSFLD